jgi:hypothetical protein
LASWNTILETRLRVGAPDLKNSGKDTVITFKDLHAQDQAMGGPWG